MNTGIITSFVISGILLLAILAMNLNVSRSSSGLTLRQINQENVNTVSELLTYDIPKIGFNRLSVISNPITTAKSNQIIYKSNIDNSDDDSEETIEWFFDTSAPVTTGNNPDDYILYRTIDGSQTKLAMGVTRFEFSYFDDNRNVLATPVANPNDIRYIKINLIMSSKEKLGNIGSADGEYIKSPWQRTFTPKNLSN